MQKVIRDLNKYLQSTESGPWSTNRVSALDRALGELNRIFDKKVGVYLDCVEVFFNIKIY